MLHIRRHQAFTPLEMCIAIGILVVLLAILIPALMNARDSAKVVKCQSNLRQIWQALSAYHGDHNVFPAAWIMPPPFRGTPTCYAGPTLYEALASYLPMNSPVYRCPTDSDQVYDRCAAVSPPHLGTSYLYWAPVISLARSEYSKDVPHAIVMMDYQGGSDHWPQPQLHRGFRYPLGGQNHLFEDGEIRYYPPSSPPQK